MANNVIGSLIVNLGLETGRLNSDTDKASRHFNKFEKRSKKSLGNIKSGAAALGRQITTLTGVVGVLSVAGLGALIKNSVDAADKIGKLSDRLGASTEALSEYKHVANLSGVTFETLTMGWQRMTRRVAEAAQGMGEAKNALAELNINAVQLNRLRPEQQFEVLADALNGVENQADKVRLSMKLFDSEGVSLIQTMKGGSEGIRAMREEAKKLGLSLDKDAVAGAVDAKDAMAQLDGAITGLTTNLAIEFAPQLSLVIRKIGTGIPRAVEQAQAGVTSFWDFLNPSGVTVNGLNTSVEHAAKRVEATKRQLDLAIANNAHESIVSKLNQELVKRQNIVLLIQKTKELEKERSALNIEVNPQSNINTTNQDVFHLGFVDDNKTRMDALRGAQAAEFSLLMEFEDAKTALVRSGNTERLEFSKWTAKQQTKHVIGEAILLTRGVTGESRKLFEINKAAGIANALINTYQGVTKSLSAYPWPVAGAMAALHLASGMAQVSAIKSTSFGGGGGAPSLAASGGTPSDPTPQTNTNQSQPNGVINVYLEGVALGDDSVRAVVIDAIEQAQANDEIRINAN